MLFEEIKNFEFSSKVEQVILGEKLQILSIKSMNKKRSRLSLTTNLDSELSKNKLYQINIEKETKFCGNLNVNELNKFQIGCPICVKDINDDIYCIGLIQSNMKKYYFTKNDIENFKKIFY